MKKYIALLVFSIFVMGTISCNRGTGCPAAQAMQQAGTMNPNDMASQKKSKKAGEKSSVLPAEDKYKKGKKKKKGCK